MGIVSGHPPIPVVPDGLPIRVVLSFQDNVHVPFERDAQLLLPDRERNEWRKLTDTHPGLRLQPYFNSKTELQTLQANAPGSAAARRLWTWFAIVCPEGTDVERVANTVRDWAGVRTAYVEPRPSPPPVHPSDDPRNKDQRYQDPALDGINARWVWKMADGAGVGFVDVETGWMLDHEDLVAASIGIISGVNYVPYRWHGTAVLGIVVGVDNDKGGVGVAPGATARVASQMRTDIDYNTADAVVSAAAAMASGDVMLVEVQTYHVNATGFMPAEAEAAVFDAIRAATDAGIVVVEAGGNGAVDLDAFTDIDGKPIFETSSSDFCDSGAIVVGAARSASRARHPDSNFGSRIDSFSWGDRIDTCWDPGTGKIDDYVPDFGGTSGASAIVAGAALLLQSWRVRNHVPRYTPAALRDLLRNTSLNTASARPAADRIGVMPNLRSIVKRETHALTETDERWHLLSKLLHTASPNGDGLVGLAMAELSALHPDEGTRRSMIEAAFETMRESLDSLAGKSGQ